MREFKVMEVSNGEATLGFMIIAMDQPAMVVVRSIRDGIAKIDQRVGFGKLYASQKSAEKALKSIKEVMSWNR